MTKDERSNGETCYELEVPGFNQSMLSVAYGDGRFAVCGERKDCSGKEVRINHSLDIGINKKVTASFDNGLITIIVR